MRASTSVVWATVSVWALAVGCGALEQHLQIAQMAGDSNDEAGALVALAELGARVTVTTTLQMQLGKVWLRSMQSLPKKSEAVNSTICVLHAK